ncbi:MAG: hypothetical protein ACON4U_18645 [Myxococcota bacterium]
MIAILMWAACSEYKVYPEPQENLPNDTGEPVELPPEPEAPIALTGVTQEAKRMVVATLDGSLSYDPDDALAELQFLWSLDSQPEGASVSFEGIETANPTFSADLLGDYIFSLVVTDADGLVSEPAYAMVSVVPYEYMIVNLSWDVSNLDLDLHLLNPTGTYYSEGDCYFGNPEPDWGVLEDQTDNPYLLTDDEGWEAIESIELLRPEEATYTVLIHHYNQRDAAMPFTTPHLRVIGDGDIIYDSDLPRITEEGLVMTAGQIDWITQTFITDFSMTSHAAMGGPAYND